MAWFTTRGSTEQSQRYLFRWPLGRLVREESDEGMLERRRAHRVDLNAAVFLYGSTKTEPFCEYSQTVDVCINGALVSVNTRLSPGQRILLTNLQTQQDLACRVVRVETRRIAAALEFLESAPRFWCIEFAPASTQR